MKTRSIKGISIIEYVALVMIVIGAFIVMKNYIQRGMHGSWQKAGQTFAFGRQYDPQKTIDCGFDQTYNVWYDRDCFAYLARQNQCNGNENCELGIITGGDCAASCNELRE